MANPTQGSWKRLKKAGRVLKGVEKVTWVMRSWRQDDEVNVDVLLDSDWAKVAREEIDKRRRDDDQRHSGETLVQNASDACGEHGGSRVLRGRHGCCRGPRDMQSMMADLGLSTQVRLGTDASRRGLGKTRHVELKY